MPSPPKSALRVHLEKRGIEISQRIKGETFDELQLRTYRLTNTLGEAYEDFFKTMSSLLAWTSSTNEVGQVVDGTPPLIRAYMGGAGRWEPLSMKWVNTKARIGAALEDEGFYHGITAARGTASPRKLGRTHHPYAARRAGWATRASARPKTGATQPFYKFIKGLADDPTATERYFGPLDVDYQFFKEGRLFKVTKDPQQGLDSVEVKSDKTLRLVMFPRDYSIKVTVTAFPKLQNVPWNEWNVVDFILKRVDPVNEKQWVKINSRTGFKPKKKYSANKKGQRLSEEKKHANRMGRSNRPIRAILTPLIAWYHKVEFETAMRKFGGLK